MFCRYETEYFYDVLADVGGFIQTTIYVFALIVFCFGKKGMILFHMINCVGPNMFIVNINVKK